MFNHKEYYIKHKERLKEYRRGYMVLNKDKVYESRRGKYPNSSLLSGARARCRKTGMEFNIDKSDIVIPSHCPYLGCSLTSLGGGLWTNVSIDRIDNSKGYIKGNIQIISYLANCMKNKATPEQLVAFAKGVLRIHDRTTNTTISS